MAITSVDVDKSVLQQIKQHTGLKTDRDVINEALRQMLARSRQAEALKAMRALDVAPNAADLPVVSYPL